MSFVKEITTNIKSKDGNSKTFNLGKHTLLIGPNESGKSSIAEAVQLALTGSAFGMLYRNKPIKSGDQLSTLRPEGSEVVYAQAVLDNGESADWVLEEGKRPKRHGVQGYALPMNDLKAVMAGSDATIRNFFYDNLIGQSINEDVLANLPEGMWGAFEEIAGAESVSVTSLITALGKRKREESSKSKAAQQMLELLNPEIVSDTQLSTLWLQLAEAERLERLKEMYRTYRDSEGQVDESNPILEKIKASLKSFGPKEKIQNMMTPDDAREKLEEAYAKKGEYQAALNAKQVVEDSKKYAQEIAELEKALINTIPALLKDQGAWKKYQKSVNEFLPSGDTFKVIDNGSVKMGLARDNGLHVALSGSTEARILAAMSAGLLENLRENGDYPALIVLDDRMWDTSTLAKTMKELEKVDCQVIVMSTQKPRGREREAWTYIELEK